MKRQLIAAGIVTALSATGLVGGAVVANAQTSGGTANPMSGLVSAIAEKFKLDESEVQSVFDEQRTAMQAEREAEVKAQVAQLVKDDKLTQAQADALNAKRAELSKEWEAKRASGQSLSQQERNAAREEQKAQLDAWFEANDIDNEYVYLLMGKGGLGRDGRGPGGRGGMSQSTDDATGSTNN